MYSLNRVQLIGRIGQDPEIRTLEGGIKVGKFSLATSERYRDKDGNWQDTPTEWHDIVVWRRLAERAEGELKKGKLVFIEGKINYRIWEDKDGNKRKSIDIVARDFRAFERPPGSGGGGGGSFPTASDAPAPFVEVKSPTTSNSSSSKPIEDTPEDDLPF